MTLGNEMNLVVLQITLRLEGNRIWPKLRELTSKLGWDNRVGYGKFMEFAIWFSFPPVSKISQHQGAASAKLRWFDVE